MTLKFGFLSTRSLYKAFGFLGLLGLPSLLGLLKIKMYKKKRNEDRAKVKAVSFNSQKLKEFKLFVKIRDPIENNFSRVVEIAMNEYMERILRDWEEILEGKEVSCASEYDEAVNGLKLYRQFKDL